MPMRCILLAGPVVRDSVANADAAKGVVLSFSFPLALPTAAPSASSAVFAMNCCVATPKPLARCSMVGRRWRRRGCGCTPAKPVGDPAATVLVAGEEVGEPMRSGDAMSCGLPHELMGDSDGLPWALALLGPAALPHGRTGDSSRARRGVGLCAPEVESCCRRWAAAEPVSASKSKAVAWGFIGGVALLLVELDNSAASPKFSLRTTVIVGPGRLSAAEALPKKADSDAPPCSCVLGDEGAVVLGVVIALLLILVALACAVDTDQGAVVPPLLLP
jgi:hypothetical protein